MYDKNIKLICILNQRHPKLTSGRMIGTELTLINPFVKFVRHVQNCENFAEFPMELPNGCCIGDCLLFTPFLPYVIGYNTMPFVNTILPLYNHSVISHYPR